MPEIKHILCAVDFSEISIKVAEYAKAMATALNADITALYVAPSLAQYVEFNVQTSNIDDFVKGIVDGASENMDKFLDKHFPDQNVKGRVVTGYAAEEILEVADEISADLIILGTHGRKGIDKILFGSVAEKVIKSAKAPVLSMRPDA